jgi:hypothetical protein
MLANDGLFQRPRFDDSVYLLHSTTHWKPLVNGYAGTEPPEYLVTREMMKTSRPRNRSPGYGPWASVTSSCTCAASGRIDGRPSRPA